jgi:hypothetical protein
MVSMIEMCLTHMRWDQVIQTAVAELAPTKRSNEIDADQKFVDVAASNVREKLRTLIGQTAVQSVVGHAKSFHLSTAAFRTNAIRAGHR